MRIEVLGCSGSDFPGYNLTGFLIDDKIMLDAGSITNVLDLDKQRKIRYVLISHAHIDHVRSLPFLLDNLLLSGYEGLPVVVVSIKEVLALIKKYIFNGFIWPDFRLFLNKGILEFLEIKTEKIYDIDGYNIEAFKVNHNTPAVGFLVEKSGKRLFYTGDTGVNKDLWGKLTVRLDTLIVEVSFPNYMTDIANLSGHLSPKLLLTELKKIKHTPRKIHIAHIKFPSFRQQIENELKIIDADIEILKDGDVVVV